MTSLKELMSKLFKSKYADHCIKLARKSTCLHMKFGAIVLSENLEIVGEGYNLPILDTTCIDTCIRDIAKIPSATRLECCYAFHAEQMALKMAGEKARNGILICAGLDSTGKVWKKGRRDFLSCPICSIHEVAYGIKYVITFSEEGWDIGAPKGALDVAIDDAVHRRQSWNKGGKK